MAEHDRDIDSNTETNRQKDRERQIKRSKFCLGEVEMLTSFFPCLRNGAGRYRVCCGPMSQ